MKNFILTSLALAGFAFGQADTSLLPQDYKCGISLRYSGTEGVDWIAEDHYHEPLYNNRRTVYLRSTTNISMYHNELNTLGTGPHASGIFHPAFPSSADMNGIMVGADGPDNILGNLDDGQIRYKVDGDLNIKMKWAEQAGTPFFPTFTLNALYSAPINFAGLTYAPFASGVAVMGSIGSNGASITDRNAYYGWGWIDAAGDEWHTIHIGDDDGRYQSDAPRTGISKTQWSSDGKMQPYIVNPKTPCITISETGDAQFYTTPAKVYFIPKIHEQITYLLPRAGTISVKMTDIYGGVVQYRLNGGSWTNNGTNVVTLADSAFSTGTNTLEARYAATPAVIRTRVIVKNPGFPSAGESHGHFLWGDSTELAKISARLSTGVYSTYWNKLKGDRQELRHNKYDDYGGRGYRKYTQGQGEIVGSGVVQNAFVALQLGWDTKRIVTDTKTYAQYAKAMLLDNVLNLDLVGREVNANQMPRPICEVSGAGYYVVNGMFETVPGYDILIGNYRSDQHADGLTPIEDHFVRDMIMNNVQCYGVGLSYGAGGLWGTATYFGAFTGAIALPSYNTHYLGTSGYDGVTTATHAWTPFPTYPVTWKSVWTDQSNTLHGYPNQAYQWGPDRGDDGYALLNNIIYQPGITYDAYWAGSIGYWNSMLKGYAILTNLSGLHTSKSWPLIEKAYGIGGVRPGQVKNAVPQTDPNKYSVRALLMTQNSRHPTSTPLIRQDMIDRGDTSKPNDLFDLVWFDDGGTVSAVLNPTFSPGSGTYPSAQTVTIASATGGATIRYTTNGTTPTISSGTVYSGPVTVSATGTLKAIAYNGVITPSQVITANYVIDEGVPVIPPPVNTPARLQGGTKVGKDSVRMGN